MTAAAQTHAGRHMLIYALLTLVLIVHGFLMATGDARAQDGGTQPTPTPTPSETATPPADDDDDEDGEDDDPPAPQPTATAQATATTGPVATATPTATASPDASPDPEDPQVLSDNISADDGGVSQTPVGGVAAGGGGLAGTGISGWWFALAAVGVAVLAAGRRD